MVDRQIVLETIQRMRDSGISENVIASTLSDIGLSKEEVGEFMQPAGPKSQTPPVSVAKPVLTSLSPVDPDSEEKDNETEDDDFEEPVPLSPVGASTQEEALHATTHVALEEQNQQLTNLSSKFSDLDEKLAKITNLPAGQLSESMTRMEKRIAGLENEVNDAKSQLAALSSVMNKVLETNRSILTELEDKK